MNSTVVYHTSATTHSSNTYPTTAFDSPGCEQLSASGHSDRWHHVYKFQPETADKYGAFGNLSLNSLDVCYGDDKFVAEELLEVVPKSPLVADSPPEQPQVPVLAVV